MMLSPHHGSAVADISLLAHCPILAVSGTEWQCTACLGYQRQLLFGTNALTSASGIAYFWNLGFCCIKMYPLSFPMVSIWRKSDQYSKRYDSKSVAVVMLSPHHGGAAGSYSYLALSSIRAGLGTECPCTACP